MTIVERGGDEAEAVLDALFPRTGRAYRIGITGLSGGGKSTLVNQLISRYRREGLTVGVVAEDPSSPFSGGALLGDRVRMVASHGDAGVFVRSIASRGSETGFSEKADELADVMDAFGRDVILLETIGIGQLEHKIRFSAHTTVIVLTPEAGDDVQSLKSGLMEIGDIFVINKSDRPGGREFADDLRSIIRLRSGEHGPLPAVVATTATKGEGLDRLVEAIREHRSRLETNGLMEGKRADALESRLKTLVEEKLKDILRENGYYRSRFDEALDGVVAGRVSPYKAAAGIVEAFKIENKNGER